MRKAMRRFAGMTAERFAAEMERRYENAKVFHDAKVAAGFKLVPIRGTAGPARWIKEGA